MMWLSRLLAFVHLIVGLFGSIIAVPFVGIWILNEPTGNRSYQSAGLVFLPLLILCFAPGIVAGTGLFFERRWARTTLLLSSFIYLFYWPLGTVLAGATLALLGPQHLGHKSSAPVPAATSAPTRWKQGMKPALAMVLVLASVLSAFDIILTLLFRYNEDYVPRALEQAFGPSLIVFPIALLLAIRFFKLPEIPLPSMPRLRWRPHTNKRKYMAEELARIDRLEADPATYKYAQLIRAGQYWRDEAIAYDLDPAALGSCIHLRPIERSMREAGVPVRLGFECLNADCCVDPVALAGVFDMSGPAKYVTIPGDRPYDPEGALLYCSEHPSFRIFVIHPDVATAQTPWFPSRPEPVAR
jgi:hypothetical protein